VCLGSIVLVVWQFVEKTGHQPDVSDRATLNNILVEVGLPRRRRPAGDSEDSDVFGGPPQEISKTLWEELVAISGLKRLRRDSSSENPSLAQLVSALSFNTDALKAGLVDHGMQQCEATRLCEKFRVLSQGMQRQSELRPIRAPRPRRDLPATMHGHHTLGTAPREPTNTSEPPHPVHTEAKRSPLHAVLAAFSTASCFSASRGTRNPIVTKSGTLIGSKFRHARDTPRAAAIATE